MKKLSIYAMMLLAAVFTACDEDFNKEVAAPQSYPQEEAQTVDGFTVALTEAFSSPITMTEEDFTNGVAYEAVRVVETPELAEGLTVKVKLELSTTDDFAKFVELPSVTNDNVATVTASDLNEAVKSLCGKAPTERTMNMRVWMYIVDGTSSSMAPSPAVLTPVKATPVGPFIDSAYYLIGDMNGWPKTDVSQLIKFNHSSKDVYEDPTFTAIIEVPENCYWKVVPQSAVDATESGAAAEFAAGALGCVIDGDTSEEGVLISEDAKAMKIEDEGWMKITLNMVDGTYSVSYLGTVSPYLYVPGDYQGWSPATASFVYSSDFSVYKGYFYMTAGGFKFTTYQNWDGTNYGAGATEGTLSTDGGAGNLSVAEDGFYLLEADVATMTWSATKTEWGIIGDATPAGWDASTPMEYNQSTGEWTIVTALTDGELKFRANNGWDINFGGNMNDLNEGGDNIPVTAGTYKITLYLGDASRYSCTFVKQ